MLLLFLKKGQRPSNTEAWTTRTDKGVLLAINGFKSVNTKREEMDSACDGGLENDHRQMLQYSICVVSLSPSTSSSLPSCDSVVVVGFSVVRCCLVAGAEERQLPTDTTTWNTGADADDTACDKSCPHPLHLISYDLSPYPPPNKTNLSIFDSSRLIVVFIIVII